MDNKHRKGPLILIAGLLIGGLITFFWVKNKDKKALEEALNSATPLESAKKLIA